MKPGAMALARVQQADGHLKARPVVVLQEMPPYRDLLVCAVSSQLRHETPGFDEIIRSTDDDFAASGLKVASLVRLGLLATLPREAILGNLGTISVTRLRKLRDRLADHLGNESQS
jgi:mRNA interferase MazF